MIIPLETGVQVQQETMIIDYKNNTTRTIYERRTFVLVIALLIRLTSQVVQGFPTTTTTPFTKSNNIRCGNFLPPLSSPSSSLWSLDNNENDADKNQDDVPFDSLDVVLERARKRRPALATKVIAVLTQPVPLLPIFSGVDILYMVVAIGLDAKGFSLGYGLGKVTSRYGSKLTILSPLQRSRLIQWWPLFMAIVMDQIIP